MGNEKSKNYSNSQKKQYNKQKKNSTINICIQTRETREKTHQWKNKFTKS